MSGSTSGQQVKTHNLSRFAFAKFWINWSVCPIALLSIASISLCFNASSAVKLSMVLAVTLMAFFTFRFNRSMAWRIDVFNDGLIFYTLLGKSIVLWTNVAGLRQRNWPMETNYVISCRDGSEFKFSSGLSEHAEIIALIRENFTSRQLLPTHLCCQDRTSLLFQSIFILCWVIAGTVAVAAGVSFVGELFYKQFLDSDSLFTALSCLGVCLLTAFPMLLRAKYVVIGTDGLTIKTWISEKKINWESIKSVRSIPLLRAQIIQSDQGWYLLGEELSDRDLVTKNINEKVLLIKSRPPVN